MRRTAYWQAAICIVAISGGGPISSIVNVGALGVAQAEAKAFYTRKRVNGRWITGRFAKNSGFKNSAVKNRAAAKSRVALASRFQRRKGAAAEDLSEAPDARRASAEPRASAEARLAVRPGRSAAPVSAAPMLATSVAAVPSAQVATGSSLVPVHEDDRLRTLREALQARVGALTTGSVAVPEALRAAPEPQSVSFDFKSGTKTTIFSDGTSIQEVFDVGSLKGLAAAPPRAKARLD